MSLPWKKGACVGGLLLAISGLLLVPAAVQAQLYEEDFEAYADGTTDPGGPWTRDVSAATPDLASVQTVSGDKVFQVQDPDGEVLWTTETLDISGASSASFQLTLSEQGDLEDSDYVDVEYSVDGGAYQRIGSWNGLGNANHTLVGQKPDDGDWGTVTVTKDQISGDDLQLRVVFNNNANSEDLLLDDVQVSGRTRVRFASAGTSVQEGNSGTRAVSADVLIQNASASSPTSVDVATTGGSGTGGTDYGFSTTTVTFPPGTSPGPQTVQVQVTGDTDVEGDEDVRLELQNATGGANATVGRPNTFVLTISGDDAPNPADGDLLISEVMYDPSSVSDTDGEWIELYNSAGRPIDLRGWTLREGASNTDVISETVRIPPGGYALLCSNSDQGANGGVSCDYEYSGPTLNNGGTTIDLERPSDGNRVDRVAYGQAGWPGASGGPIVFTGAAADDNNAGGSWTAATAREPGFSPGSGDAGSPGIRGSDQTLAVKRPMDSGTAGWRFVSPPQSGPTVQYLATQGFVQGVAGSNPNGDVNVYLKYSPPEGQEGATNKQYWEPATDVTAPLERGRGAIWYLWKGEVPDFLETNASIGGVANDYTLSGLGDHKWHLLGNPFPNPFRIGGLNLAAQSFSTTAQVWDVGQQTYQLVGPSQTDEAVGPQMGFWVERTSNSGTESSLTFSASGQVLGNETVVRKRGGGGGQPEGHAQFELVGTDASGDTTTIDKALSLVLRSGAEAGFDPHDATKLTPFSGAFVALAFGPAEGRPDSTRRSVASYPLPASGTRSVPLHLVTGRSPSVETLTLRWPALDVPAGWSAFLEDRVAGDTVDLQSKQRYTFSPSASQKAALAEAAPGDADPGAPLPGASRSGTPRSGRSGTDGVPRGLTPPRPIPLSEALPEASPEGSSPRERKMKERKMKKAEGGGSDARFRLVLTEGQALPVELARFKVTQSGKEVILSWSTASEQNNAGFEVHRKPAEAGSSAEGAGGGPWETVGFVESKAPSGTTSEPRRYRFADREAFTGEEVPYVADSMRYRLKQLDTDGTASLTDPVTVALPAADGLGLLGTYPNPAQSQVTIRYALPKRHEATLRLYDVLGREVRTVVGGKQEGRRQAGRQQVTLDVSELPSGVYFLRLESAGKTQTRKFTVLR